MKKILVLNPYQTSIAQQIADKVSNPSEVFLIPSVSISETFNIPETNCKAIIDKIISISTEAEELYPKSLIVADLRIFTKEQAIDMKERWNPDMSLWIDTGFDVAEQKPTFEKGEVDWRLKKANSTNISFLAGMLSSIATQEDVSYVVSG